MSIIGSLYEEESNSNLKTDHQKADKFMMQIMFLNWVLVSTFGGYFYQTYMFGFITGGILFITSFIFYKLYSGKAIFRIIIGILLPIFAMILVQQSFGRIEMHFHYFVLLAFLTIYKDYKPVTISAIVIVIQHLVFTYLQLNEVSLFGINVIIYNYGCSYDIALLHGFFVLLEWTILRIIIKNNILNFEKIHEYKGKLLKKSLDVINQNLIASKTDLKGIITEVSDKFCEISKYSREELIGKSHNIVRHPDMPEELYKDIWNTIKSKKTWHGEIKNLDKNGDAYWVDTTIIPDFDSDDNHVGYTSIRHDITNNKKIEVLNTQLIDEMTENKKKELLLIEQNKMAALGEMIGNIAHQWKQPLNTISIIVSGLKLEKIMGTLKLEELEKPFDDILDSINYSSNTINTFKNFVKEKKEKKEMIVQDRIEQSLKIVGPVLEYNDIKLKLELNKDKPISFVSVSGELDEVIINILNNAKDAIIENKIVDSWIKIEVTKNDSKCIVSIEDNAGGIPDHIIDSIFDQYYTTKENSNGTGIGLYMSRRIITETLNGDLYVKNSENGAKFFIEFNTN